MVDPRIGRNRLREPYVTADHRVVSDGGVAPEDGASGVDDDVVLDLRVAAHPFQLLVHVGGAERHSLVDLHVVADNAGLPDHDARTVVDVEPFADRGPRVDVDSRLAVGPFGHHARQDRDVQFVHHVGQPVDGHGVESRVAEDHLLLAVGGGVAAVVHFGVLHQPGEDERNFAEETLRERFAAALLRGAQRGDDLQEPFLYLFPAQFYLLERHVLVGTHQEEEVDQRVDELAGLDRGGDFAVERAGHLVEACREIFQRIGHRAAISFVLFLP